MRRTELTKKTARNKGFAALGSASATVLLMWMISWWMAILGVPVTAWLTYRWFKYRAKWGLRF
jgi:hypothetical protein